MLYSSAETEAGLRRLDYGLCLLSLLGNLDEREKLVDIPMNQEARKIIIEVAKHLVTITIASIGFLVTLMFTTLKETPYIFISPNIVIFTITLFHFFGAYSNVSSRRRVK